MSEILDAPPAEPPAPPARVRHVWRPFVILAVLLLFAGEAALGVGELYGWQAIGHAKPPPAAPDESAVLAGLQAQLSLLEKSTAPGPDAGLTANVASLTAQLNALTGQVTALEGQAGADHAALATLQGAQANFASFPGKLARLAALQRAALALQAGQSLGDVPDAPPALAAFAETAPPTLGALVLAFPSAARAGDAASVDGEHEATVWSRFWARLENLITITDGDHVILGPPAAGVIDQARQELAAGDLAGAVASLSTLSETTQNAMAGWLRPARALLAAQDALLKLSEKAE